MLLIGDNLTLDQLGFKASNIIYIEYASDGEQWPCDLVETEYLSSSKSGSLQT